MSRKVVMTILAIILLLGLTANTVFAQAGGPMHRPLRSTSPVARRTSPPKTSTPT